MGPAPVSVRAPRRICGGHEECERRARPGSRAPLPEMKFSALQFGRFSQTLIINHCTYRLMICSFMYMVRRTLSPLRPLKLLTPQLQVLSKNETFWHWKRAPPLRPFASTNSSFRIRTCHIANLHKSAAPSTSLSLSLVIIYGHLPAPYAAFSGPGTCPSAHSGRYWGGNNSSLAVSASSSLRTITRA